MKIRSLLLGSVAAIGLTTGAYAVNLGAMTSLDVCDALGLSVHTMASNEHCLEAASVGYDLKFDGYVLDLMGDGVKKVSGIKTLPQEVLDLDKVFSGETIMAAGMLVLDVYPDGDGVWVEDDLIGGSVGAMFPLFQGKMLKDPSKSLDTAVFKLLIPWTNDDALDRHHVFETAEADLHLPFVDFGQSWSVTEPGINRDAARRGTVRILDESSLGVGS